jgi:aminopeptidase
LAARLRSRQAASEAQFRRAAAGELRWAVALHPSPGEAEEAGLSLRAFADLVYAAAFCDEEDPIAAWERQERRQSVLRERLEAGRVLRLQAPGTDLTLRVDGRTWRSSSARRNLPDGELFTAPHETSAEGEVLFSYPGLHDGRRIEGIRLVLRGGEVVEATARSEQDALRETLAVDAGARRLGEVGIGTNLRLDRFCANTLLDEKIGGTFHLALGRAYLETGGTNASALHWDLVCDMRQGGLLELDGEPLQRDGRFLPGTGLGDG